MTQNVRLFDLVLLNCISYVWPIRRTFLLHEVCGESHRDSSISFGGLRSEPPKVQHWAPPSANAQLIELVLRSITRPLPALSFQLSLQLSSLLLLFSSKSPSSNSRGCEKNEAPIVDGPIQLEA